jgi:hypothetical protein
VLEIDCPESCQYLRDGRTHEVEANARYYQSSDPAKQVRNQRVLSQFEGFISSLEVVLAEERRSSRDFKDQDASAALDLVLANLRTEQKGVLYERTSDDVRVEVTRRRLSEAVQAARFPNRKEQNTDLVVGASGEKALKLGDVIECLETVRDVVQNHLDEGPTAPSYVDFLARLLPSRRSLETTGSSLIIPGR